jgi:spore photoproduct lyase
MFPFRPETFYVVGEAAEDGLARSIIERCPGTPVEECANRRELQRRFSSGEIDGEKASRSVVLARNAAPFLKPCPGTRHYLCCGYYTLNCQVNCSIGCTYCILPGYLREPFITVFTNREAIGREIAEADKAGRILRIGTGELTDSLFLDSLTGCSEFLVPLFSRFRRAYLELKTKTDRVEHLAGLDHGGRTIVAWSVNAPRKIAEEERDAPTLDSRLRAARKCIEYGYRVAFHFDPLFYFPGWEEEMRETVDRVFHRIDPSRIAWISMGTLRYPKEQKSSLTRSGKARPRFLSGEFVLCRDGKMRYFRPVRTEIYRSVLARIRAFSDDVPVYLCMESRDVWNDVFGRAPSSNRELAALLDRAAVTDPRGPSGSARRTLSSA